MISFTRVQQETVGRELFSQKSVTKPCVEKVYEVLLHDVTMRLYRCYTDVKTKRRKDSFFAQMIYTGRLLVERTNY